MLRIDDLTPAERRYGHSAARTATVTYQADVVVPPSGAAAIRGLSADGLVWTLDPLADGVGEIQPGKVLLLTSRAAGRVLAVESATDGLRVVLGPAAITEIIRDAQFAVDQPIDLTQALQFDTPEPFDAVRSVDPLIARAAGPVSMMPAIMPVAYTLIRQAPKHAFSVTPIVGTGVAGVRIVSNDGSGVKFLGEAALDLSAPTVHFTFDVRGGRIVTSEVALTGVAGLLMKFEAAQSAPRETNINQIRSAVSDFAVPLGGLGGVPIALNLRQQIDLRTAFTSTGVLKAHAYYTLRGGIRAGYRDGRWGVEGPTGFGAKATMLPTINGAAIGVTGLVLTHHLSVIAGIGAAGFVTGPYAYLNSNVSVARGSSVGMDAGFGVLGHGQVCKRESVNMGVGAGIGYQMPQTVVDVINRILQILRINRQIEGRGGISTKPVILVSAGWYHPQGLSCGP